jgi:hypothetical protein
MNLRNLLIIGILAATLGAAACVPSGTNSGNSNAPSENNNANNANANTDTAPGSDAGIDVREPDVYRTKINFTAEALGDKKTTLPSIAVDYARNKADRRISFNIPGTGSVVYLDVADKRYVILPDRKEYAEITKADTGGVEIPSSLTPGEIVSRLRSTKGANRIGEETLNGRTVIKYKFAGSKPTGTAAGDVSAEAFVYVDKETGLPVRSETVSQGSNQIKGVGGIKLITEMSDIQTTVEPSVFQLPSGLKQISTAEIKAKVKAAAQVALMLLSQLQQQNAGSAPGGSPSPAMKPSPAN